MEQTLQPIVARKHSLLAFRSSTAFITLVVSYAVFTEQFLYAVIVPVAPFALHERQHVREGRIQYWVALLLAIYGIASIVSSQPWGWWTDRHASRRTPFLVGLVMLLAATVLLWFANSKALLVLGRLFQGVAATIVWTTGLAVLVDTVGEEHIGEYVGYVGIALNLGTLFAPMLGGVVFARAGYNAVFAMASAVIVVDIVLRLAMVERGVAELRTVGVAAKDIETASTLSIPLQIKPTELVRRPTIDREASSDALVTLTVLKPQASGKWQLPPVITLLFSCRFLSAFWGVVVQATLYSGFQAVLPLELFRIFGWHSTGGGLIFVPLIAPGLLGPLAGALADRFGPRWLAVAGFVGLCPSLILLRLVDHDSMDQKILLCALLVVIGLCITCTLEPLIAEITYLGGSQNEENARGRGQGKSSYAQAYALFNMAWSCGDTIGPLLAGLVLEAAGWETMTLCLGLLAGVSAIPTLLWCGGWIFHSTEST